MKDYLCKAEDFERLHEQVSERVCKKYGITLTALQILTFLDHHPERNTAKDICSCRFIKNSIASMTIDKLVNRGYILRECDKKDRRVQRLKLTPEAEPVVQDGHSMRRYFEDIVFRDFTEEEKTLFLSMIDRICDSVQQTVDNRNEKR